MGNKKRKKKNRHYDGDSPVSTLPFTLTAYIIN